MDTRGRMPPVKVDMYASAEEVALRHPEYHQDFYIFICEVITAAQNVAYPDEAKRKHLSSSDVYLAFCSMIQNRYGALAMATLNFWGVKSPGDIGKAIFYLSEEGILIPSKRDKKENFEDMPALELMLDLPFHVPNL